MTLVARTAGDPERVTQAIRREVTAIDAELPFYGVRSMGERVSLSLLSRRTPMLLAVMFAAVALFLASVGIYGVLAYQVSQRRREIGIRLALGSDGPRIFRLVVREGLMLLAIGVLIGFGGAVAIRRAMESQLFGVQPLEPLVLASVAGLLGLVAFTACAVPARRAARIDPLIALSDQ
jgi:putative ABC transport system permease protein